MHQLEEDYKEAPVDEKTRAILDYAIQLTQEPGNAWEQGLPLLRKVGCDDREILDICQVTAYFNFVNRLAEGLGVELEEETAP